MVTVKVVFQTWLFQKEYKSNIHLKEIRTLNKILIYKTPGLHLSRELGYSG